MTSREIPTGTSESGYANPEYDLLFEEQSREIDSARRRELVWRLQRLAFDDVVYIVPYYARARQAYRIDRFQGWIVDQPRLALEDVSSLVRIEPGAMTGVQR
jgi:ABC-type transport system substrate-binding protein